MALNRRVYESILVKAGLNEGQLARAREEARLRGVKLEVAVLGLKLLDEEAVRAALAKHMRVPFVSLAERYDPDLLKHLPESIIKKYQVLPVESREGALTLGMVNPLDPFALDYVALLTQLKIKPVGVLETHFDRVVEQHFALTGVESLVKDISIPEVSAAAAEAVRAESGPVAKLVTTLLTQAVRMRASDIHLEPQENDFVIRFRIDGLLRTIEVLPRQIMPNVLGRIKVLAGMDVSERRLPQDGRIDVRLLDRSVDLRASSLPGKYGEKLVLRVLDKSTFLLGMDQLGLPSEIQLRLEEIAAASAGMLLVTGPTGSGKTTTLYALVDRMRSPTINILTLEDPVEYELLGGRRREAGITQVQISPKIGLDFAAGLRACLRQDPDVLLIGEVRDRETAEIAFTTALTGHFVLSSLHTNDAPSTVARLLDMQVEPFLITASLRGVLAQRLVRRLCPNCKEAYRPPKKLLERMAAQLPEAKPETSLFRPKGCPDCAGTGYRGRLGLYELLEMGEEMVRLVTERGALSELRAAARAARMMTLRQAGVEATFRGLTTMAEVVRVTPP